jgi:hypothetical protein
MQWMPTSLLKVVSCSKVQSNMNQPRIHYKQVAIVNPANPALLVVMAIVI